MPAVASIGEVFVNSPRSISRPDRCSRRTKAPRWPLLACGEAVRRGPSLVALIGDPQSGWEAVVLDIATLGHVPCVEDSVNSAGVANNFAGRRSTPPIRTVLLASEA